MLSTSTKLHSAKELDYRGDTTNANSRLHKAKSELNEDAITL